MTDIAQRDGNYVPTMLGVDSIAFTNPTTLAINPVTHAAKVEANLAPGTTGGWSKAISAAQSTTITTIKASGGKFGGYYIYNPNATVAYLQVFDEDGTVTLGTTAPNMTYGIPAEAGANVEMANGINMENAIKIAVATTATGNGAVGTGLDITIYYI